MATPVAIPSTSSPFAADVVRAFARAQAERLIVRRTGTVRWSVNGHQLAETGDGPLALSCDCEAARHGRLCKHRAGVAYCRKHGHDVALITDEPAPSPIFATCISCRRPYAFDEAHPLRCPACD